MNPARRELRVAADDVDMTLDGLEWVYVQPADDSELRCKTASLRRSGDQVFIALAAGIPKDTVAELRNAIVFVEASERAVLNRLPYTGADLVGFEIVQRNGTMTRRITECFSTPAHDVLEIEGEAGECLLVPLVPELIADVDWDNRTIRVDDLTPFAVHESAEGRTRLA